MPQTISLGRSARIRFRRYFSARNQSCSGDPTGLPRSSHKRYAKRRTRSGLASGINRVSRLGITLSSRTDGTVRTIRKVGQKSGSGPRPFGRRALPLQISRFGVSEPRGGLPVQGLSTGMRIPSRFRRELLPRRIGLWPPFLGGGPLAMATIAVGESVGRGAAVRLLHCRARR